MNKGAVIAALLLLSSFASAALNVSIEPVGAARLYQHEVKYFRVSVENASDSIAKNIEVELSAPAQVSFPIDGVDGQRRHFTFLSILPRMKETRDFDVKALDAAAGTVQLSAEADESGQKYSASAAIEILPSAISFSVVPPKSAVKVGENSSAVFSVSNDSNSAVSALRVEVFSPDGAPVEGTPFEKDSLAANESLSQSIGFRLGREPRSDALLMRLFFDDELGTHVLEKPLRFETDSKGLYAVILAALVLLVVLWHFHKKGMLFGGGESGSGFGGGGQKKSDKGNSHGGENKGKWASKENH